jgi:thioesterase domain-containing protein
LGVLAFETAQQLVQMAHKVSFIGVIDGWAPDYVRQLGAVRLKAADFAFRCNSIYAEIRAGKRSVRRGLTRRLMKPFTWFLRASGTDASPVSSAPERETIEQLNTMEMLYYLWRLQGAYEPKLFLGRVHSFVSPFRATGWLVDSALGWGRLAREGAEAVTVTGDHSSMFFEPGGGQIAATIAAALEAPAARKHSKAPSTRQPFAQTARPRQQIRS